MKRSPWLSFAMRRLTLADIGDGREASATGSLISDLHSRSRGAQASGGLPGESRLPAGNSTRRDLGYTATGLLEAGRVWRWVGSGADGAGALQYSPFASG